MHIQIDHHTLEGAEELGTNGDEIRDVISTGVSIPGKYGRLGKAKVYDYRKERQGEYYEQKRLEVFYRMERGIIITVTVYVFLGKWEAANADTL